MVQNRPICVQHVSASEYSVILEGEKSLKNYGSCRLLGPQCSTTRFNHIFCEKTKESRATWIHSSCDEH